MPSGTGTDLLHAVHVHLGFSRDAVDARAQLALYPTLTRLCEEQARLGLRVTVVERFWRDEDVEESGVRYLLRRDGAAPLAGPFPSPRIPGLVRSLAPDVVHFNGLLFPLHVAALRAALPREVPIVVQHHGERPGGSRLKRIAQAALRGSFDALLVTGEETSRPWRDAGLLGSVPCRDVLEASSDFEPVPAGVARTRTGLAGEPAVLWVGRLHERKDPRTALLAFRASLASIPGATLTMAYREAPLEPELKRLVAEDPLLCPRVRFLGSVPHAELPAWLSAADLLLTSSPAEGSGYALIEALACGLWPVLSDIPSHRSIAGTHGSWFPAGDAEAGAAALAAGWRERGPREAVRARFDERLAWPVVARQVVTAYRHAVAGRRA